MTDRKQLSEIYKQNLENDIILHIAKIKGIEIRKAFDIYYSSRLVNQIERGDCGIENLDAKYLAEDLIENERELFEEKEQASISDATEEDSKKSLDERIQEAILVLEGLEQVHEGKTKDFNAVCDRLEKKYMD